MPVLDPNALVSDRVHAIRQFHRDAGVDRAELDVSGGIDSAVMLGLLARAIGPENVTAVYSAIDSTHASRERARAAAAVFRVDLVEIDLGPLYHALLDGMVDSLAAAGQDRTTIAARIAADPTITGSIRSTLRAPVGRGFNRLAGGGIRHGTGNECEDRWLRFFQKGGDGEVDTNPIAVLSKGEVYQLARALGVPRAIRMARPTPDLWGSGIAHNDEDEIAVVLGVDPGRHGFYTTVDPDSGEYTRVGLIERVARFWDTGESDALAPSAPEFRGVEPALVRDLLVAARRMERATRHKANPNQPSLGDRATLVRAGILTDTLPTGAPSATARSTA